MERKNGNIVHSPAMGVGLSDNRCGEGSNIKGICGKNLT
jgi:hypothetical protein